MFKEVTAVVAEVAITRKGGDGRCCSSGDGDDIPGCSSSIFDDVTTQVIHLDSVSGTIQKSQCRQSNCFSNWKRYLINKWCCK